MIWIVWYAGTVKQFAVEYNLFSIETVKLFSNLWCNWYLVLYLYSVQVHVPVHFRNVRSLYTCTVSIKLYR